MFRNLALLASFALTAVLAEPTDDCPILGPIFPHSFDLSTSEIFINATEQFPDIIAALFEAGAVNETGQAFHLDVFSTETNSSIYSYSHLGSAVESSQQGGEIGDETIFRIGSVSKLYTAYTIIAAAGLEVFRDPVTKYIPELEGNPRDQPHDYIIWEDVTVGSLLHQQGGTGGVPAESALCFADPENPCTTELYFDWMKNLKRPTIRPWTTPLYSDNGFALLARIIERVTNQTFEESLISVLGEPLGLNSTSTTLPPEGSNIFALEGGLQVSSWGQDAFLSEGSGGVYSNGADMRAIGLSILHSELLSPQDTREWMKPHGHTSALGTSLGGPWEIFRLALPVSPGSDRTRISDVYTKAGGQNGYGTVLALSPDHGLGFSLNVAGAGATSARWPLREALGSFVVAAEHAAAAYTADSFAGTYADPNSGATNITLSVEPDKPGMNLEGFFVENVDWRVNVSAPLELGNVPSANLSIRLYPNGIVAPNGDVGFYGVPGVTPFSPRSAAEGGPALFETGCETWLNLAFWSFNGSWPESFIFNVVDGQAKSVYWPGAQLLMEKVEA